MPELPINLIYSLLLFTDSVIVIAVLDFIQVGYQLVEGVAIDDQAGNAFGRIAYDVGRSQVIPVRKKHT